MGVLALLATTGTVVASAKHASAASEYKVGIVYSRTGLLAAYGAEYIQGLQLRPPVRDQRHQQGQRQVPQRSPLADDKTDPATGVSAMKDLIGQGYKIIAGATSSGVALQEAPIAAQNQVLFISGPAASDAITGLNKYTFRSGRQTYQDVATAATYLGKTTGKNVLVFAQDSAFGQGNFAAVKAIVGGKGHNVSALYVPLTATDFTPFAQQAKQAKPDLLYVAWAGATAAQIWSALDQQGVFSASTTS